MIVDDGGERRGQKANGSTALSRRPIFGQRNKITRRWAKRGTWPSAPHDQPTWSAYILGAICPKLGKAVALVMPLSDTHAMTRQLAEIARHVDEDAHAILIMDQAEWHMSNNLVVPENITIPLQPKSLELTRSKPLAIHARKPALEPHP